ncbi:MAG: hypothetical protein HY721_04890 [Planctomycetes bacterium]|nr:hypothetical protein [Planctomycetota bacterium]
MSRRLALVRALAFALPAHLAQAESLGAGQDPPQPRAEPRRPDERAQQVPREAPPERQKSPWADVRREITAERVAKGPVVDGRLDDEAWKAAESGGPLVQATPYEGTEPSFPTDFKVVYDGESLYVGVWCYDPQPETIVATEMAHDGRITADDYVIVVLDTFLDRRNGYELRTNPNGARGEALISDNVSVNESWDGIWTAAATIDGEGWKAELAIPFKTLSFDPGSDTWGFNILRNIKRLSERDRWVAARPEIHTYNVAEAGNLTGLRGLEQGLGLDVTPYALGRHRWDHETSDEDFVSELGGDARYRITPNLTASLSYNTDFAETEVDARQVNLSRFPLFFPEKRAFFLEDSGIFRFGGLGSSLIPFFSRRIGLSSEGEVVPIVAAGKLTGRLHGFNVGVLDAVVDSGGDLGHKNAFAARVTRNVLEQSSVGLLATLGDPSSEEESFTGGGDFGYRTTRLFGDNVLQANAFVLGSYTEGFAGRDNLAYGASVSMPNDLYSASAQVFQIDEDFNPALGFVPRKGVRAYSGSLSYTPRPRAVEEVRQLYFTYSTTHYTDLDDRLDTASHSLYPLYVLLESSDTVFFSLNAQFDSPQEDFEISRDVVIPADEYWWGYMATGFETASKRPAELEVSYSVGDFYDGERSSYSTAVDLKPSKHFVVRFSHSLNQVRLPEGDFDTRLGSVRMQVSFTPDLIWHHLVQHDSVSDTIGYQSRVAWEVRPGARLFVVLNQNTDRAGSDLTWLESELTLKLGVTLRF